MGSGASAKKNQTVQVVSQDKKAQKELKRIFNSSPFNIKSEFWLKTGQHLFTGGYSPDLFSTSLYKSFRRFIIESCLVLKKQPETTPVIAPLAPPPLVDELWCQAILLKESYRQLCQSLIGQVIHRDPLSHLEGFDKLYKKTWPAYDPEFWMHDRKYTVWIADSVLTSFLEKVYEYVYLRDSLKNHQKVYEIYFHLNMVRSILQNSRNKEAAKRIYAEVSKENMFYGVKLTEGLEELYDKILSEIPKGTKEYIDSKLCLGELCQIYIEEYARFLTLAYLQPGFVTASHEIELVWKVHRTLTVEYSRFSEKVFGKELNIQSISEKREKKENLIKGYLKTIDLYILVFRQRPPTLIWDSIDDWVNYSNTKGSWFSLLRIIESVQTLIQIYKAKQVKPEVIILAYFCWGKNMKTEKLKEFIDRKKIQKKEESPIIFINEGEEPEEFSWNRNWTVKVTGNAHENNEDLELPVNGYIEDTRTRKRISSIKQENLSKDYEDKDLGDERNNEIDKIDDNFSALNKSEIADESKIKNSERKNTGKKESEGNMKLKSIDEKYSFNDKSIDKSPKKSIDKSPNKSIDKSLNKSIDKSPNKSIDKSLNKSIDKSPNKSIDKIPNQSIEKNLDKSKDKSPDKSIDKKSRKSKNKSPTKNIDQSLDESSNFQDTFNKEKNDSPSRDKISLHKYSDDFEEPASIDSGRKNQSPPKEKVEFEEEHFKESPKKTDQSHVKAKKKGHRKNPSPKKSDLKNINEKSLLSEDEDLLEINS